MIIKKLLIAGGNSTALVYDCPISDRKNISRELLKEVEQVGFITKTAAFPEITMMGGELCVNATIAFASTLDPGGKIRIHGLDKAISYLNDKGLSTIHIPIKFEQNGNVVLLEGIGYVLYSLKEKSEIRKSDLSIYQKKHNLPAFGGIIYDENRIMPFIYVAGVNSFIKETACGSGSLAYNIYTGIKEVIQPTGRTISIDKQADFFSISAEVMNL
jgi:hypothetical protein